VAKRESSGGSWAARLRASARNALEIARFGTLGGGAAGAGERGATFDIVDQGPHHRLRRYPVRRDPSSGSPPPPIILLVPPLMVTADVYDIAEDVSAAAALAAHGIEPWVVDFGAPEREEGGMKRSLDDHVRAVVHAIERANALTTDERDGGVHVSGYSQGGMFAYQAAAYLRGKGIKSLITFGSPVDIHKNVPALRSDLAGIALRSIFPVAKTVLERIEGLPGKLTSTAFKVVSTRKEVEQRIDFLRTLHDRDRTMKREARRKFLGGGGFVAWPGPAFRSFVEDFVVHNRMLSGGFVIDGRTVSLSDIKCPILAVIGGTDEIARPPTIRAIRDAAPEAEVHFATVPAGHFGIVVGSRAMTTTWPMVATWIHAIEAGKRPDLPKDHEEEEEANPHEPTGEEEEDEEELALLLDMASRTANQAWRRLGDAVASASGTADVVRWQEPRLRRLARIEPETKISASRELAKRARETPDETFFLWRGRAFSYRDADRRVTNIARGLHACGVKKGERVLIAMGSRPSLVSTTTALGRIGAVGVVAPPALDDIQQPLRDIIERLDIKRAIVDPERVDLPLPAGVEILLLGGGGNRKRGPALPLLVHSTVKDMEAIDPETIALPSDLELDPGRASDVALVLLRPDPDPQGNFRPLPVTNHRWALSAIGAAAACAIKPSDTVFCALPLHHPTGLLVSIGAALAGGARLALYTPDQAHIDTNDFVMELRRVGATIVFYAGEMLRPLLRAHGKLAVRLFAGSGMRPALAARIRERFAVDTMEFYAGTTHRAILADAAGDAPGSLGRILPGSAEVALVRADLATKRFHLTDNGRLLRATDNELALLAVQITEEEGETLSFAGAHRSRLVPNAFGGDDDNTTWFVTSDVIVRDSSGRHWFVDAANDFVLLPGDEQSTINLRKVEDALYTLPEIDLVAAWEMVRGLGEIGIAFVSQDPIALDRLTTALLTLPKGARPSFVARLPEMPLTDGFRPNKRALPEHAASAEERWHLVDGAYVR
jgi:putative long chain acyl-CoA synthase